jgi:hypothetical protein
MNVPYRVLLPVWVWDQKQKDKDKFNRLLTEYMKRYPHYIVIGTKDGFAICERMEKL